MRKLLVPVFLAVLLLCVSFAAAENQSGESGGQGRAVNPPDETTIENASDVSEENGTVLISSNPNANQNSDEEQNNSDIGLLKGDVSWQRMARNVTELKEIIALRKQEMNQSMAGLRPAEVKVYQNQNQVREAVHALLAMENIAGGIGKNVSLIAREFNNSVNKTVEMEKKIQTRSSFVRFFIGGDEKTADELQQELNQNRARINNLVQYQETVDSDLKEVLQEQIQNLEREQTRLQELAQKEKKSKGIFGWIFK